MKKIKIIVSILICITIGGYIYYTSQQTKMKGAFASAARDDQIEYYERFLRKFPSSKYVKVAQGRIEELNMEKRARNEDSVEVYEEIIKKYPNGSYAQYSPLRIKYLKHLEKMGVPGTINIVVHPFEGNLKDVSYALDFAEDAGRLFRAAGIKVLDSKKDQAKSVLEIKARGNVSGASYVPEHSIGPARFLYTGASISGELVFKGNDRAITKTFLGGKEYDKKVRDGIIGGRHVYESKKDAPFRMAYNFSNYMPQLLEMLNELCGQDALLHCFAWYSWEREMHEQVLNKKNDYMEPLLDYVGDNNIRRAKYVVELLGKIGDKRATGPLVNLLEEIVIINDYENKDDRYKHIARRFGRFGKVGDNIRSLASSLLDALGNLADKRGFDTLLRYFNQMDWSQGSHKYWALSAIGSTGDPRAYAIIFPLLQEKDPSIRSVAASALGKTGDKRAFEAISNQLKNDKIINARRGAADGLGYLGDRRGVEYLVAALEISNNDLRRDAMNALTRLTGQSFKVTHGDWRGQSDTEWKKWWEENKDKY